MEEHRRSEVLKVLLVSVPLEEEYTNPVKLMCKLWKQGKSSDRRLDRFWGSEEEGINFSRKRTEILGIGSFTTNAW